MNNFKIALGILLSIALTCLIFLFCLALVKLYIKKIKEHSQKELLFQKELNTAIIETQEQVLNNISQELHDDAGQQLTYINFQLENLKLDMPELNAQLEPLSQSVGNLSQSIRTISHSLNNQLLMQQDVIKAISTEVERLQKNPKINFQLQVNQPVQKVFTTNEKIVIYRIFQEIINNALKHAKATEIKISITASDYFGMTIQDNGKGFDYAQPSNTQSLGLFNMKNRASILDYDLTIQSTPGEGTRICLSENKKQDG
ncbi:MAG: sensor histidine kinase [Flavobacterium sp.]|jgi:signal transduction histidine kinase|uniref:sensor histidine kinase n=1 Tax=Flavobacterium sp. TaxID=239 RepID=UPI003BA4F6A7